MNSLKDCFTLNNGVQIPCVGFGTWQTPDGDVARSCVKEAIRVGYRHIDTAAVYANEESVGEGIAQGGVAREELFITTKVWNGDHGYDETLAAFELSMKKLKLDYLDLYLIHWPNPAKFRHEWQARNAGTWRAMEELYAAKKIRAIGISNFRPHHMDELLKTAKVLPMVNQIRLCPGETQPETVAYCNERNILLEAYSPLGTGKIFDVPQMQAFAQKYGKSIAQICIRWSLQMGWLPLPKTVSAGRIAENADVFGFTLEEADVAAIAALTGCCGPTNDPDTTSF